MVNTELSINPYMAKKVLKKDHSDVEQIHISPGHTLPKVIKRIKFKSINQKRYYDAIEHPETNIIMAQAVAGVGKTFISIQKGIEMLLDKTSDINKLIIINPTVDVGNEDKLGYLPGTLMEKIGFHAESALFILHKIIGEVETQKLVDKKKLEFRVLNFLRGINFENAYVILDEAQNTSPLQLKTLLTRISDDCKMIVQGDLTQTDKFKLNGHQDYEKSGFYDVWKRLGGVQGVHQIEFNKDDCVRSNIVRRVLEAYETDNAIILGEKNYLDI